MSNHRLSSPYFRYLKARLWNFARPGFWGTAIFLSVVGLTIREFWMRPDLLTSRQSKSTAIQPKPNSTLSAEDRAIVADIDTLPILRYDSEQGVQSTLDKDTDINTLDTAEPIAKPKKVNQNLLDEAIKNQKSSSNTGLDSKSIAAPSIKYDNPFLTQAQNLLQFGNTSRNNSFVGLNTFNASNQSNQTNQVNSLGLRVESTNSYDSTQTLVGANSLQVALNTSSRNQTNQLPNQTSFNSQNLYNQSSNFINSNNFNSTNNLPQGLTQSFGTPVNISTQTLNNSVSPTQFTQPTIATTTQPQIYYGNLNGTNLNQTPTQTQIFNNLNGANSTQPQIYNNLNNSNFNTQPLPNNTITSQAASTVNTVPYPSTTTASPRITIKNGNIIITPSVQQPNSTVSSPSQTEIQNQYPNSGLPVRY
ncbi:MAG: hypothetical protein IGS39_24340 [Calothrix sp. C42_A2020_038]|nr:hypothetical protein [Calothrix sp. C42_A2020_038]